MICVFSLIILFNFSLFSQTIEVVDFGTFQEFDKYSQFQKIVGNDEEGFYTLRSEGIHGKIDPFSKIWLEYYTSLLLTYESSNELIMPTVGGIQTEYSEMFYIDKKLILFSTAKDVSKGKIILYVQYMEANGTLKNKPKKIGEIPVGNFDKDMFHYILTENKTKIAIWFNNSFMTYNDEPISFVIIDSNLQIEYNEAITLPFKERKLDITQVKIGESGNIYMLIHAEQVNTKKNKAKEMYDFIMFVYSMKNQEFQTYTIEIAKYFPTQVLFELNKKEELVFMGYFSGKTTKVEGEFLGAFYKVLDPRIQKFIEPANPKDDFILFDKTFLNENITGRNGLLPDQYNNFILKDIFVLENNSMILLAENYFETTTTFTDPQTKQEKTLNYLNYSDIIATGVNKDGKFDWVKRIPKNQNSMDDNGYYSSYFATAELSKIKIFINDNGSNKKKDMPLDKIKQQKFRLEKAPVSVPYIVTLYADGSYEKDPMFAGGEGKCTVVPRMFYKMGDRYISILLKGKTYKFAGFLFE